MLISLLVAILLIFSGASWNSAKDLELGGGPIVNAENSSQGKEEKISLKRFKNIPRLKENPDPKPPLSWSHSAVAIDAESGKILYGKDERKKMPIASLTKVMTAIVLDEQIKSWDQDVRVSKKAAFSGGANIDLKWDEVVKARNLFKAMIMNSDNAAAIALAEHVSQDTGKFTELMNKKAKELGSLDTYFKDPSGLEDEISHSTAYDMAKITQYALTKDNITRIMQTKGPLEISSCDGLLKHRVGNTNVFLKDENIAPKIIGGKTGFTYKAGYCLMTVMQSKEKGKEIIGVILNSGEEMRWEEMKQMINWCFENYNW